MLTPLHLQILLHYYTSPEPWPMLGVGCNSAYACHLCDRGLLERPIGNLSNPAGYFSITDKGRFMVNYLCATPIPEAVKVYRVDEFKREVRS
jgi:hypothetical protein